MAHYKIINTTRVGFENIELDIKIGLKVGDEIELLGDNFIVTQEGFIVSLRSTSSEGLNTWLLTLQQLIISQSVDAPLTIEDIRFTKEIDIYFEDAVIKLNHTDRLNTKKGLTYKVFYDVLKKEWDIIKRIDIENNILKEFPLEYREHGNLLIKNGWKLETKSLLFLKEGSCTHVDINGKCIS